MTLQEASDAYRFVRTRAALTRPAGAKDVSTDALCESGPTKNEDAAWRSGSRIGASSRLLRPTLPSPDQPRPGSLVGSWCPQRRSDRCATNARARSAAGCRGLRRSATPRRPPKRGLRRLRLRAELRALAHSARVIIGVMNELDRHVRRNLSRARQRPRAVRPMYCSERGFRNHSADPERIASGKPSNNQQSAAALLPGFRPIVDTVTFAHCVHQHAQCPSWAATHECRHQRLQDGRSSLLSQATYVRGRRPSAAGCASEVLLRATLLQDDVLGQRAFTAPTKVRLRP